jgi:hypothetical protein
MKKLVGILFVVMMLVGCSNVGTNSLETKTLTQFYKKDLQNVSKIVIVDGSTGYKKTIDENTVIEDFLDEIKDIKFIPEDNQEGKVGWRYSITLSQDDEYTFQFGLTQVNDHYYLTEPDIYPIVDNFYKTVDVQEE